MGKNSVHESYKDCNQNLDEFNSWFSFKFTNNEIIRFDEIELRIITKTIKRIVRTYLKIKNLFSFKFFLK